MCLPVENNGEAACCGDCAPRQYNIVRFFKNTGRRKIIRHNVTRAEAQQHCSRENTKKAGVWFDGFEEAR